MAKPTRPQHLHAIPQARLDEMRAWGLDEKIDHAQWTIANWFYYWKGRVYVSFSGGLDSTVVLDLVRTNPHYANPETIPACFADTGLEFPEIRAFVRTFGGVEWVKPKMSFKRTIDHYGYPVISKRVAQYVAEVQRSRGETATKRLRLTGIKTDGTFSELGRIPLKHQHLCAAPFKIHDACCDIMKKRPLKVMSERFGYPILGTRADEGNQRLLTYKQFGCNAFDLTAPRSTPIAIWTGQDVLKYIRRKGLAYSSIYDMGYPRTGCMFCLFGIHLEKGPNRFQRMYETHPAQWRYCMDKLGVQAVMDYLGLPTKPEKRDTQLTLFET